MNKSSETPHESDFHEDFPNLFNHSERPQGATRNPTEAPSAVSFDDQRVFWAARNLPASEARKNFFICGGFGTGISLTIQLFLQSIAPRFRSGQTRAEQLIVFDSKSDILPLLAASGLRPEDENVWILNPFDPRGAIWNIAEAAQGPVMARHFATQLVPAEPRGTAPFFTEAAREILYAVILALNTLKGKTWTLRDLLCALESPCRIRQVTASDSQAERHAVQFMRDELHLECVLATLHIKLAPLRQVAALWHDAEPRRGFSIAEFLNRPGVLVLGIEPVYAEVMTTLNALVLQAVTQEIFAQPDASAAFAPRHWFVFDDLESMDSIEPACRLQSAGRRKGVSIVVGTQSLASLSAKYGEQRVNEMISQCGHKSFLRLSDMRSARQAEEIFHSPADVLFEWWDDDGEILSSRRRINRMMKYSCIRKAPNSFLRKLAFLYRAKCIFQQSVKAEPFLTAAFFLQVPSIARDAVFLSVSEIPSASAVVISRVSFGKLLGWCKFPARTVALPPDTRQQDFPDWSEEEKGFFCRGLPQ